MLLTIDVGNTNTVLGVFEGEQVIEHWRVATDPGRTADEIAVVLQGLLGQSAVLKDSDVTGIALCSTVPSVLHEMREMFQRYYGDVPALIVEPGVRTGVSIRMDNPKEVGSDRIMNTVAAVDLYGGPAVVVDFGTFHQLRRGQRAGEFVGGALAPRHRDLRRCPLRPRGAAAARSSWPAAARDRQEHGRGPAVRHPLRLRRPGRGHRRADAARAGPAIPDSG